MNALNNERDDTLKSFVSKINMASLLQNFSDSPIENLYEWARLLDRLAYAYSEKERETFADLLKAPLSAKSQEVTIKSVGIFYYSMAEMFYLNKNLILELLTNNIDKFQILCTNKTEEAMDVFDFDLIDHVCGISHFSPHKPTKQQRDFSRKFVNALPVIEVANFISHSLPRNWRRIYDIGLLLHRENKKKYFKIVKAVDYDILNKTTSSLWRKTDGDLHLLFCFISYGDSASGQQLLVKNKDKIQELGLAFIENLPELTIELFENGVKLRLFENHWNDATFYALKNLHSFSAKKYKEILAAEVAQFAHRISEFCVLDFEKYEKTLYEIIAYVEETYPEVISDIVPLLDFSKMKEEKQRMLKDDRFDRRGKKHFSELINLLIEHSEEINVIKLQEIKNLK